MKREKPSLHLRYRAREALWYVSFSKLTGTPGKATMWTGPFRTAMGAATLQLNEPFDAGKSVQPSK